MAQAKPDDKELENSSENVEQLHAICYPRTIYELKFILKKESLFDSRRPVLRVGDQDQSIAKIPTIFTRSKSTLDDTILSIHHPSIAISQSILQSLSGILLGFQWVQTSSSSSINQNKKQSASPLIKSIELFFGSEMLNNQSLINDLPRWELYQSFLLFQSNGFQSNILVELLNANDDNEAINENLRNKSSEFFKIVADQFQVTHIARKGLIERNDVSRRPKILPLYGEFRSKGYREEEPNKNFSQVFWTSTRFKTARGIIKYVWSPSETMYSRGNSKEKLRISNLNNVNGEIVVDMCSGIGFFSFPYLLAGASQVIACEISPWAVEGLRRGSIANGFSYEILNKMDQKSSRGKERIDSMSEPKLLIYQGSNELALPIYRHKATHVNLGLLPSSIEFLPQSIEALRPEGGWLHIHGEIAAAGGPIARQEAAKNWADLLVNRVIELGRQSVHLVDIHWIKSIGPSREHIVVELKVGSR